MHAEPKYFTAMPATRAAVSGTTGSHVDCAAAGDNQRNHGGHRHSAIDY
jgi:hypothetical protein